MAKYINVDAMHASILELLKDELEKMDLENKEFVSEELNDDWIDEYSFELASEFDSDMKTYLHTDDKSIAGNFGRIDLDYCKHITGEYNSDDKLIKDLVSRLDREDQGAQTLSDLDYLNEWFWDAFGTFGITYNFSSLVYDMLYEYEHERELETA